MTEDNRCIGAHISEPQAWLVAFRRAARREGLTLSQWIGEACLQRLPDRVRRSLPPRPQMGRRKETNSDGRM